MVAIDLVKAVTTQNWKDKFDRWAQGPGQIEKDKCENAERMIRDAIRDHAGLNSRDIKVFVQGSYRNRTNVRMDSDVDVCVLCKDAFFPDYSFVPDINNAALGFTDARYQFDALKLDVENALVAKFGRKAVTPGDKAFDIKENTYRVSADVVPTFEGRLYYRDSLGNLTYQSGTVLQSTRTSQLIRNWPEQHYNNGVEKHTQTSRQFKKKVRILKNLCNKMADSGISSAKEMASFLLESLVYNCPDSVFTYATHYEDMKEIIRYLWQNTQTDDFAKDMLEVNAIKYLFHVSQPWKRSTTHTFLLDAWNYVGFGDS